MKITCDARLLDPCSGQHCRILEAAYAIVTGDGRCMMRNSETNVKFRDRDRSDIPASSHDVNDPCSSPATMEYDRKSTVSSFYGRKSSDALNNDYPAPSSQYTGARPRDDASSFFGGPPTGTAGYNRGSFFHAGREEPLKGGDEEQGEGGFDIYADFNNAGPKYSSGFTGYSSNQAHECV